MNLQFSFKICHIKVNVPYTILLITFAHALPRALSIVHPGHTYLRQIIRYAIVKFHIFYTLIIF
jgi:hypothetical protein